MRPYYGGSTNLGPGYRFNYLTTRPPGDAINLDSAEYANITVHFLLWYARARAAGMPALPRGDRDVLTAWVERVLFGYWTHSGFLNWDSGLGLKRWQIGKTLAFAQQGLLAIARADDFHARPEFGAWAKYFFDRGLALYTRWADEEGGGTLAPAWLNGVHAEVGGGDASKILFGARMAANAARAIDLGLGERAAQQPPPFYAYDPDIGRLAVSTPAYSTAVLAANHGAVDYGGIELARLYDGDGRPVATIGGRPPAAFGVVVRDVANRTLLASQTSRLQPSLADPPLRLTRAPRGTGRRRRPPAPRLRGAVPAPRRPRRRGGRRRPHRHRAPLPRRVRREHVDRVVGRPRAPQRRRALPGVDSAAQIDAVLHDGTRVALGRGAISLARVAWFHLRGERSGYVVVVSDRTPMHATARTLATTPQRYEPRPGSTLARCASCAPRASAGARSPRASRRPATPTRPPAWRRRWALADHLAPQPAQAQSTFAADDQDAPNGHDQVARGRELREHEDPGEDRRGVEQGAQSTHAIRARPAARARARRMGPRPGPVANRRSGWRRAGAAR